MGKPSQITFHPVNSLGDFKPLELKKVFSKFPFNSIEKYHPQSAIGNDLVNTKFVGGYSETEFGLYFQVREPEIKAVHLEDGCSVYEDSCVEFFFQTNEYEYLNLEFNCVGTSLAGQGKGRGNRVRFSSSKYQEIKRWTSLPKEQIISSDNNLIWEILFVFPRTWAHIDKTANTLKGNVYKTGDNLSHPHWGTFFEVPTPKPDFHRPEFFGEIKLG